MPHAGKSRKRNIDGMLKARRPSFKFWSRCILVAFSYICIQTKTTVAFSSTPYTYIHRRITCHFGKNTDDEDFGSTNGNKEGSRNGSGSDDSISNLDMKTFQNRKHKRMLQTQQQRWYQPPNPLLEEPVDFVQALLVALQERKKYGAWNGALCLLRSSTPSWRKLLLKSVGAPTDATNDQVAPTLQTALERSNNQFAILTMNLDEETTDHSDFTTTIGSIQKCWDFPSDPVLYEEEENDDENDYCWIESRLRSPKDNELLAVVGWSLKRRRITQKQQSENSNDFRDDAYDSNMCWLLDGIDWQDFRDEFRPGIGREEWERICG